MSGKNFGAQDFCYPAKKQRSARYSAKGMHQPNVTRINILGIAKVRLDCVQQRVGALWQIPFMTPQLILRRFTPIRTHSVLVHLSRTCCPRDVSAFACANDAEFSFCIYLQMTINFMSAFFIKIYCAQWQVFRPFTFCILKHSSSLLRTWQFFTRHPVAFCALAALSVLAMHSLWSQLAGLATPSQLAGIPSHFDEWEKITHYM